MSTFLLAFALVWSVVLAYVTQMYVRQRRLQREAAALDDERLMPPAPKFLRDSRSFRSRSGS